MKTVSIFLALINSLLAGLLLANNLSPTEFHQIPVWWLSIKVAAASCVILVALITWLGSARSLHPGWMALCSLFLVALGARSSPGRFIWH